MTNSLSIITVNLNNAEGLQRTISSVLEQDLAGVEFVIIDGGSTDGSREIIDSHTDFIHYWVSEKDSGVYHAMNKGIKKSSGEYLLFLNSGDLLYSPDTLSSVFSQFRQADFLCGRSAIVRDGSVVHVTNPPEKHTFATYYRATISHQATFIKKSVFDLYGYYREDFRYNSDYEFWIRTIILQNCSTEKISTIVCYYDLNGISSTENQTEAYLSEIEQILNTPLLQKFVPDYESWYQQRSDMKPLYWVKSKKYMYAGILCVYKLALWLRKR